MSVKKAPGLRPISSSDISWLNLQELGVCMAVGKYDHPINGDTSISCSEEGKRSSVVCETKIFPTIGLCLNIPHNYVHQILMQVGPRLWRNDNERITNADR
jgi:hypothetical protein